MARKKPVVDSSYVLFDVIYEDGRLTSNRKVPGAELGGLDGDTPAKTFIEEQDRKIAELHDDVAAEKRYDGSRSCGG